MFAKLKTFFNKETQKSNSLLSDQFDHSQITSGDASQCPFMNKKSKASEQNPNVCPVTGKKIQNSNVESDSEDQKPKGGCPFMSTSGKKKNPNLNLNETAFDEPFVSKFKFYLSASKMNFSYMKKGIPPSISRQLFNNYPIYLQHTLFYNGEDYKKVRGLECCSRFMAYEQLRQKGNKFFNKGQYYEALDYYERAMSLFKWLQYYQPLNESKAYSQSALMSEQSLDEISERGSKVQIKLSEQKQKTEDPQSGFDELKTKYKEFFITYCDDNTKECDGEDLTDTADVDMRKSLLIQIYLNMCAAYIQTHHYSLAERVCDDGLVLSDRVSQLYFRKAQALSLRKDCTIPQLELAKTLINRAIEMRGNEKIYTTANPNILKMLNLHNSAEAYEECRQHVQTRIKQISANMTIIYAKIYNRTKQIHQIEQRIISEGKIPKEGCGDKALYDTTEMKIVQRMTNKYVKVIEFYTESKNQEQIGLAKKEFQEVLRVNFQVKNLFDIQLRENEGELGGLETDKIQKRVAYVKSAFAENVYNTGKFNFTMLQWVIKEIVKEETEEKKRKVEAEQKMKQNQAAENGPVAVKGGYGKLVYLLLLIPLALILLNMYIF